MKRIVRPEILDLLPPADPRAAGSRRDLYRINRLLRHHTIMAEALAENWRGHAPEHITEIGAGDGAFLHNVATRIFHHWPNVRATLLDRQKSVPSKTLDSFTSLGWRADTLVTDVFDWLAPAARSQVIVANHFLHHFETPRLTELLDRVSQSTRLFVALEPLRGMWPLLCSRQLWAIGCNHVTRHDAAVSVRAGFARNELSALWPDWRDWQLTEQRAGPFSHLFIARKFDYA